MKKNRVTFYALIFFFCLGMTFALQPLEVQASPKMATPSNGKYIYYAAANEICRMDTNTGKIKTIAEPKNSGVKFGETVYYKGYVYFTSSVGSPVTGEDYYICRVKAKGGKIKRLAKGSHPVVYNKKLYYIINNAGRTSICRMSLNGKNKKRLISGAGISYTINIVNNRIYYLLNSYVQDEDYDNYYDDNYFLYSANLKGKDIREVSTEAVYGFESDGKDIYYTTTDAVHRMVGKTGKDTVLPNLSGKNTGLLEVRDGVIYFEDNNKLKKYVVSKSKATTLKTFKSFVDDMVVGKGKYAVIKRANPANSEGEMIGRIKTNGKGYKTLKKYWLI